ncbi:hypothetical protein Gotur_010266, partial [Gossypium turneri]
MQKDRDVEATTSTKKPNPYQKHCSRFKIQLY